MRRLVADDEVQATATAVLDFIRKLSGEIAADTAHEAMPSPERARARQRPPVREPLRPTRAA